VSVLGVDFDPELARNLRKKGYSVKFGDGQDQAFLDTLPIKGARWVIVTMTDLENNFRGLLHEMNFSGKVAGVARDSVQTKSLELQGIDHIFNPFIDGADFAAQTILKDCGKQRRDR
jgi:Trk K+ transport system NAD-binding subunit